jgi:hypothetical protein
MSEERRLKNGADLPSVVPISEMRGENDEETRGLRRMFEEAHEFLSSFSWCQRIEESFFGFGYARIVAVYLFKIVPDRAGVDDWLWVVVGDLPPAYLVTEGNSTPDLALDAYIGEMSKWVEAAKKRRSVRHLIPVNVPATKRNAEALEGRLNALRNIIRDTVLPHKSNRASREVH